MPANQCLLVRLDLNFLERRSPQLGRMPKLRVVMLHSGIAKDGWRRLIRRHPTLVAGRQLALVFARSKLEQAGWPQRLLKIGRAVGVFAGL